MDMDFKSVDEYERDRQETLFRIQIREQRRHRHMDISL